MNPNAQAAMPSLSWTAGWCFNAVIAHREPARQSGCILRTLGMPGDIAPLDIPARWSFHLGLSTRPCLPRAQVRADEFRIRFTWDGCECIVRGVLVEPGILIGYTDAPLQPSLFSAEHEIHRAGDVEWLETEGLHVVLVPSMQGNLRTFCLAAGPRNHGEAVNLARDYLDGDIRSVFEEGGALRQRIADRLTDIPPGSEELVSHAVESLLARIQPVGGPFPQRWCSTGTIANPSLNVHRLYGLIAAWSRLDSRMAENTIRTLFAFQRPDGALPVMLTADGSADFARAPYPMLARTVQILEGNTAFLRYALPHLRSYLSWALHRFDPLETGLPRWGSAHEAWIGATFDPRIYSADLAALLLCEIEAYEAMAQKVSMAEAGEFRTAAGRFARMLHTRFWDPSMKAFLDTFDSGAHVERITLGTVPVLWWNGLGGGERNAVLKLLDRSNVLSTPHGIAQWEHWEGDPQKPPVFASDQVVVLDGILQSQAGALDRKIRVTLWKSLETGYARSQKLCDELSIAQSSDRSDGERMLYGLSDAAASSLAVVLAGPLIASVEEEDKTPGISGWITRHAKAVVGTAVAVPIAVALSISIAFMAKTTPPISTIEVSLWMAAQYYREGQYEKAIALYEDMARKTSRSLRLEIPLGNAYFRRGDLQRAESLYRAALNQPTPPPAALLNLGLALFRQGRLEEALSCYSQYLDVFGDRWPDQAERAKTAIDLIQQYHNNTENRFSQGS